jgi:hypothetical protein
MLVINGGPVYATNTTYYVDSVNGNDTNDGTSTSTAWRTLSKVNSMTFQPGDHILFKAGCTWTGQLMPQGSGSSGSPIVIDMYGTGSKPVIDANGTTNNDGAVVRLYNQQYWEISNLDIKNDATSGDWRNGVLVMAKDYGTCNHIYIGNCNIHDICADDDNNVYLSDLVFKNCNYNDNIVNCQSGNMGGIIFRALRGSSSVPTCFNDIKIENNTVENIHDFGIGIGMVSEWAQTDGVDNNVWGRVTYSTNVHISDNYTDTTGDAGINVSTLDGSVGDGVIVERNIVYNAMAYDSGAAIWTLVAKDVIFQYNEVDYVPLRINADCMALDIDTQCDGTIWQYNYVHDVAGVVLCACVATQQQNNYYNNHYCKNNIFRYNIGLNNTNSPSSDTPEIWVGWGDYGCNNNVFYNNTLIRSAGAPSICVVNWGAETGFFNNIFYYDDVDGIGSWNANYFGTGYFDHNCYGPNINVTGRPYDAHAVLGDAGFVNPNGGGNGRNSCDGYKLLSSSQCVDAGITMPDNGGKDYFENIVYNGWRAGERTGCYDGDYHSTYKTGEYYQITFNGTQTQIYAATSSYDGKADIYVDGSFMTTIDCYSATKVEQVLQYDTGVLAAGNHIVKVVVNGTKNALSKGYWIELDKVQIYGTDAGTYNDNSSKVVYSSNTEYSPCDIGANEYTPDPNAVMVNDTDAGITYNGSWVYENNRPYTDYQLDTHYTLVNDDYFEYTFTGVGIEYIAEKSVYQGDVDIYIDGVFQQTVSCYSTTWQCQQVVFYKTGLSSGSHTIKCVKKNGGFMLLDALRYIVPPVTINDADAGITYNGSWVYESNRPYTDYQLDTHYTSVNGDYFEYTFTGTSMEYITEKSVYQGDIDIYIDGVFQQTVSCYSTTWLCQQVMFYKTGLSSGSHTIKCVKKNGGFMLLDALRYTL